MLLRAGWVRTAISNSSRKLSSASRASTEKKKINTQKWPVQKSLSLVTQTPLMSPLTLWNQVKGFKKRPTYANYLHRLGPLHANEWQAYSNWKKYNLPKEVIGTIRNLLPEELRYFEFAQWYYKYTVNKTQP
jgi:hypothetical protein